MELGNYGNQQRSPLTASGASTLSGAGRPSARSSLSNAAFFANADDDYTNSSGASLSSSFFVNTQQSANGHSGSSFTREGRHAATGAVVSAEGMRPSPAFSPYGVEYVSSPYYSSTNYRKKWTYRCIILFTILGVLAAGIWLLIGRKTGFNVVEMGLSQGPGGGCATGKTDPCNSYTFPDGFTGADVKLVDYNHTTNHFLFRSNLPLERTSGAFARDSLLHFMVAQADKHGHSFPADPLIQDYSLLHPDWTMNAINELCELAAEACYYEQNHDAGFIVNWPLVGETQSPYTIKDEEMRLTKARQLNDWSKDKIDSKVEELHAQLRKPHTKPVATVFHCHFGKDRTGTVAAAYKMRFLGYSLKKVWNENNVLGEDAAQFIYSIMWYCLYLEQQIPQLKPQCYDIYPLVGKSTTPAAPPSSTAADPSQVTPSDSAVKSSAASGQSPAPADRLFRS